MNVKKVLIAVDASENARRAVEYVAEIVGDSAGFQVTLLHVLRHTEQDLFPSIEAWEEKKRLDREKARQILSDLGSLLAEKGLAMDSVQHRLIEIDDFSIAQAVLDYQQKEGFGTVVVGRRGMSKAEEFLFGSISNKIVHYAKNCAVWVIE